MYKPIWEETVNNGMWLETHELSYSYDVDNLIEKLISLKNKYPESKLEIERNNNDDWDVYEAWHEIPEHHKTRRDKYEQELLSWETQETEKEKTLFEQLKKKYEG